jgi:uncharacterized LabA/DUF88 family protein
MLDDLIESNQLAGVIEQSNTIWVGLKVVRDYDGNAKLYRAFPLPTTVPSYALSRQSKPRVAVFIDGQNLLIGLNELKCGIKPAEIIRRIVAYYNTVTIRFYICMSADVGKKTRQIISAEGLEDIRAIGGIEIISRPLHQKHGTLGRSYRSNMDPVMLTDIVSSYYENPGLQGIVVASGDGDFLPAFELWTKDHNGGPKFVEVVSCRESLAQKLVYAPGLSLRDLTSFMREDEETFE